MKKITTNITGGHPFDLQDIEFLQKSYTECFNAMIDGLAPIMDTQTPKCVVLSGCRVYKTTANTYNINEGWIAVDGEVYQVDADVINVIHPSGSFYWVLNDTSDAVLSPVNYFSSGSQSPHRVRKMRLVHTALNPPNGYLVTLPLQNLREVIMGYQWCKYYNVSTNHSLQLIPGSTLVPISNLYNYYPISTPITGVVGAMDRMTKLSEGSVINFYFQSELAFSENSSGIAIADNEAAFSMIDPAGILANPVAVFKIGDTATFVMIDGYWQMVGRTSAAAMALMSIAGDGIWHIVGNTNEPQYQDNIFNHYDTSDPVSFMKDDKAMVHLNGKFIISSPLTGSSGAIIFYLPLGFRPKSKKYFICPHLVSNSTIYGTRPITIDTNGAIEVDSTYVSAYTFVITELSNIQFKT